LPYGENLVKIGPVDTEIILSERFINKERNDGVHLCLS